MDNTTETIEKDLSLSIKVTEIISHLLRSGDLEGAYQILDKEHSYNHDSLEIITALKVIMFWYERQQEYIAKSNIFSPQDKIYFFFEQWKWFIEKFTPYLEAPFKEGIRSIKYWVFNQALEVLLTVNDNYFPDIDIWLARCYKAIGDKEQALPLLERSWHERTEIQPHLIAELGDLYSIIGNNKLAQMCLREAFFISPDKIQIAYLDSPLITQLVEKTIEFNYTGKRLLEWLPVYGYAFNILRSSRELKDFEAESLKQKIYQLKSELENKSMLWQTIPRLINSYFWLLDQIINQGGSREQQEEILLEIKWLDENIFNIYNKNRQRR